jgi:short chain dehydrogenase
MGKLDGKVAIVTGAARGLGRAYAKRLAGLGARVAVADLNLRSYEEFEAEAKDMTADNTVAEIEAMGGSAKDRAPSGGEGMSVPSCWLSDAVPMYGWITHHGSASETPHQGGHLDLHRGASGEAERPQWSSRGRANCELFLTPSNCDQPCRSRMVKLAPVVRALGMAGVGHLDHMIVVVDDSVGEDPFPGWNFRR